MTRAHLPLRSLTILALLLLVMAACAPGIAEPTATPTPSPTPEILSGSGEGEGQSDTDTEAEPAAEEDAPDSQPVSGSAGCLVGTWAVDHDSFAGYMQDAFESNAGGSGLEFNFGTGSGDLFMTFTSDGSMSVSGDDFQVSVEIPALSAQFTFFVNAEGEASYAADEQAIAAWDFQYSSDAAGAGVVMGAETGEATAVIHVTPDRLWGYSTASGYTYHVDETPEESSTSPYTCDGDTLILGVQDYQPVHWNRVN